MTWVEYTEAKWRNLDMNLLNVDESYINLLIDNPKKIVLHYLYEDCFKCPFQKIDVKGSFIKMVGSRAVTLKLLEKNDDEQMSRNVTDLCTFNVLLGEFGVYNLSVIDNKCSISVDKQPVNIYLPILTLILIIFGMLLFYKTINFIWKTFRTRVQNVEENHERNNEDSTGKKRLKSLDIFRGLVICLMIFVNSGGGHYFWIEHAPWNGLHVADIVFPSFLWIMGVAIPLSVQGQINRSIEKKTLLKNVFIRGIKLFLIGLCLNSMNGPPLNNLRIMGVLQRFGISYLICASFYICFAKATTVLQATGVRKYINDLILTRNQLLFSGILVATHLSIIFGLKIPNCPQGYLGAGGIADNASYPNCTGGATGYIDEIIFGKDHLYQHSTAKMLYKSKNFDPEGLFGCLPSIVQVFLGIQCGVILQVYPHWKARCARLQIWAVLLGLGGGCLCLFSKEDGIIPINKNLWSISFVMTTSGLAFFIFCVLYILVDINKVWNGFPFLEAGMNSIVLYVGHSVLHKMLPWHWHIGLMNTHFILMIESLWNTMLWVLIAVKMHRRKIYYNV